MSRQAPSSSFLFVPALRLDRLEKALTSGADEVIIDLEDAIPRSNKSGARDALQRCEPSRPVHVRVNAADSDFFNDDLTVVSQLSFVKGIVVPKASFDSPTDTWRRHLGRGVSLIALLESPKAILRASDVAQSGFDRLALGPVDLAACLATPTSDDLMWYPRSMLVFASAAFGLEPPVDGPSLSVSDAVAVAQESQIARRLGMGGKLCIHPFQVPIVNEAFKSDNDIAWAQDVLEEAKKHDGNAFVWQAKMVDRAVLLHARRLLGPSSSGQEPT